MVRYEILVQSGADITRFRLGQALEKRVQPHHKQHMLTCEMPALATTSYKEVTIVKKQKKN